MKFFFLLDCIVTFEADALIVTCSLGVLKELVRPEVRKHVVGARSFNLTPLS